VPWNVVDVREVIKKLGEQQAKPYKPKTVVRTGKNDWSHIDLAIAKLDVL
jgi:hypothetical protein